MNFSLLLRYITPHRNVLLAIAALLLVSSAAALTQPWLAGQLTQTLLSPGNSLYTINTILFLWLVLLVLRALLGFTTRYYIGNTSEVMTAGLRARLFTHMQTLPLSYHYQRRSGDTLSLLSYDAAHISSFVTDTLVPLLPLLLTFFGAFIMMAWIDPMIACAALILMPAFFLATKIIGRRIRPLSHAWMEAHGGFISFLYENLAMQSAIKSFVREPTEQQHFQQRNDTLLSLSRRQLLVQSLLSPTVGLMAGLGLLLLLWAGSARLAQGGLSAPQLISLLLYALLLGQPLRGLADTYGKVQLTLGAARRILTFLQQSPEPDDHGGRALPRVRGDIRFEAVYFRYPDNGQPTGRAVLENLSFSIAAGQTVAITGANGAGKSTLAHLLLRLADPDSGRIYIDGQDISEVSLASLRAQVGLVSQHTLLINGSVRDNIAYGQPLVDDVRIEAAAVAAHADEFIRRLPQGYDTLIGDQGLRLSGGQRQRLSLARTLLLDPPILILDEATSMFDPAAEQAFLAQRRARAGERTVILISHRPATLALAGQHIELRTPDSVVSTLETKETRAKRESDHTPGAAGTNSADIITAVDKRNRFRYGNETQG